LVVLVGGIQLLQLFADLCELQHLSLDFSDQHVTEGFQCN
jgi:hypothetical protein